MSRIITALVVLPFLIASILISWLQPLFVLLAAAAMVLGLFEFYVLAKKRDLKPDAVAGYLAGAALFVVFYITRPWQLSDMLLTDSGDADQSSFRHADRRDSARRTLRQDARFSGRDDSRRALRRFPRRASGRSAHRVHASTFGRPALVLLSCPHGRRYRRLLRRQDFRQT